MCFHMEFVLYENVDCQDICTAFEKIDGIKLHLDVLNIRIGVQFF
jgi:hypothetical protein